MKVAFYTLGCKVNFYETEAVLNSFKKKDYDIVDYNDIADVYIINTCTVTNTSDQKSRKIIRQAINKNKNAVIAVMGCYSQIKSDEINKLDGVDIVIGTKDKSKMIDLVEEVLQNKKAINNVTDINDITFEDMQLDSVGSRTRAFVKIQDGCNNYCSYCIIPYARGNIRSKNKGSVIDEITKLVNKGYIEIVLTGIHTGHYGVDLKDYDLALLLNELSNIKGLERIRISSIEITELNDKMLNTLKNNKIIVDHLHVPLQSGTDKILKLMNRKYDTEYFLNKINKIRSIRPDIAITTDVIVGFPGETEEDFNETYEFIKKVNFSALHVFPYSKREGTKAATMPNQIDGNVKKERVNKLIKLSNELEINYMKKFINQTLDIIPEEYRDGYLIGHTSNYLKVKVVGREDDIGKLLKVKIKDIKYPYCIGE